MSGRLLKCYGYCNEKHPKEELVKVGKQNHCKPCAEKKEKEKKDREVLYQTIQKIFNIPFPSGHILRQIKMFKEERNYTYEGMTKTLCYFVSIQKKKPFKNGGLSFVPYWYDTAIQYYDDLEEKRKNMKKVDNTEKRITIKPRQNSKRQEIINKRIVSMEGLLNDN